MPLDILLRRDLGLALQQDAKGLQHERLGQDGGAGRAVERAALGVRMGQQMGLTLLREPRGSVAAHADDGAAVVLHGADRRLHLGGLAAVGDEDDDIARHELAAGAVHGLGAVQEIGRRARGGEQRGRIARQMRGLADAGDVQALARRFGREDQLRRALERGIVHVVQRGGDVLARRAGEFFIIGFPGTFHISALQSAHAAGHGRSDLGQRGKRRHRAETGDRQGRRVVGKAQGVLGGQAAADRHAERADERVARGSRIDGLDAGDGRTEHELAVLHEGRTGRADGDEQLFHALFAELRSGGADGGLVDMAALVADGNAAQVAGLVLIRGEVRQAGKQLLGQRGAGGRVQHDGHTLVVGIFCNDRVDLHRDLELEHDEVKFGDAVLQEGDVLRRDGHVRAGHDEDAVLGAAVRLLLEDDDGAAGGRVVVIEDAGRVDPGLFAGAAHLVAVRVVTELAAHRDLRAEAGHLHGLIGALAAGSLVEALGEDRLALTREDARRDDLVHDKAADDQNFRFLSHCVSPFLRVSAADRETDFHSRRRRTARQLVKKVPSGLFRQAAFRIAKSIFAA